MSYCRWSSDNFKSAVYIYESIEGWVTHVAASELIGEAPFGEYLDVIKDIPVDEWTRRYKERENWFKNVERKKIGLPFDGQTFIDQTAHECASRLQTIKDAGYHVPDGVIEDLESEEP